MTLRLKPVFPSSLPMRFGGEESPAVALPPLPVPGLHAQVGRPSNAELRETARMICRDFWFGASYEPTRHHLGRLAKGARTCFILLKDKTGQVVASAGLGPGKEVPGVRNIFRLFFSDRMTDAYFDHIFISQGHRHRGLGRWFVEVMTNRAKELGFRRVITDAINETSAELLAQMGYQEHWRFKNHRYMTKSLVPPTLTPPTENV